MFEFHVSRKSRNTFGFDQSLFSYDGRMIFANFKAARDVAQIINSKRNKDNLPFLSIKASYLNAMGLIDEIYHHLLANHKNQSGANLFVEALELIETQLSPEILYETLQNFVYQFPTTAIYQNQTTISAYLEEDTAGIPNRAIALEEMLLLWIENNNPAFQPFSALFSDSELAKYSDYLNVINVLKTHLKQQNSPSTGYENLWELLLSPIRAAPNSLFGQLEFLIKRFGTILGDLYFRLLSSLDFVKEEEKASFTGPGISEVPVYDQLSRYGSSEDAIGYSQDQFWMPRLILIAKNIYVWLDQLSKKYQRHIKHLDEIPDDELRTLSEWGFTGIWLIGLWERSTASAKIKQLCGNPEAISSAYSLKDYRIADDLGGEPAMDHLQRQAWQFGIRIASDMVPNHMAIDSNWVMQHPEWFISSAHSPYPAYTYNGPDLSPTPGVSINIEDHYYDRTDAAVTFKRYDHQTGETQYIYHGNDGTSMPWNDTAQLNYLRADVREQVIQTIISVAKRFPIIRFDAAMTLTKKHFQRLWFPLPGSGGDIASRAEHSISADAFDSFMPEEFWRVVVDRVAAEVPDTLLLAEAFWLMEGYFVRTLGMHRVYNSAFMNMLRDEENEKYRKLITNTLEFDPQILNRYVNFMNNPDERTAVDQFGKDDKYFGICALMATLPGLPMFGHGQIEGFTEKYGMEYKKAYWDEKADFYLVERHEKQIFPLLKHRHLFAGIDNFQFYDFVRSDGSIDENVFAYSNRFENQSGLVLYNNKYQKTAGTIQQSRAFVQHLSSHHNLVTKKLYEGLAISGDHGKYTIFKDIAKDTRYYIRESSQIVEKGLFFELEAYSLHTFVEIYEVDDDACGTYRQLCDYLDGAPVANLESAAHFIKTQQIISAFEDLINPGFYRYLLDSAGDSDKSEAIFTNAIDQAKAKYSHLLSEIKDYKLLENNNDQLIVAEVLNNLDWLLSEKYSPQFQNALSDVIKCTNSLYQLGKQDTKDFVSSILITWIFVRQNGQLESMNDYPVISHGWFHEFNHSDAVARTFEALLKRSSAEFDLDISLISALIKLQNWYQVASPDLGISAEVLLNEWFATPELVSYLMVNNYNETAFFNMERYELLTAWFCLIGAFGIETDSELTSEQKEKHLNHLYLIKDNLLTRLNNSKYQVNNLFAKLS